MDLSGAPARLCVSNPPPVRSAPGRFAQISNARPRTWRDRHGAVMLRGGPTLTPSPLAHPLARPDRHVVLDLAGDAVPVINYKKLKRAQDASAPAAPAGASGRDPMAAGAPPPGGGAAAMRMGGGLAPGDGAGNHMAAVIRRIEGFYSAPRFDDSDEDDETRGDADDDADDDAENAASSDDDDFEDDGRDPNDPAVIKEKEERRAKRLALKAALEAEKAKRSDGTAADASNKQKKKGSRPPEEWYDMDDDFIDDDELDEYFERNGRKDKLGGSGGDRFYVNKGDLEFVDDGTGAANALRRARAVALCGHAGGKEWSEDDMNALRAGVAKHGRRWQTIKNDESFAATLRDFSVDAIKHKWKNMVRRGQVTLDANGAYVAGAVSSANGSRIPQTATEKNAFENSMALRDEKEKDVDGVAPTTTPSPPGGDSSARRAAAAADAGGALAPSAPAAGEAASARPANVPQTFGALNPDGTRRTTSSGLGKDGVYSEALTRALEAARAATARETPPEKGSRARLPDGIVAELENIVLICKGPGGDPQASLPRGILKELMSFLGPFCSPVTLQKRMSAMSEAVAPRAREPDDESDAFRGATVY